MNLFQDFFNLFFPKSCLSCGTSLKGNEKNICLSCFIQIPTIDFEKQDALIMNKIFWGRVAVEQVASYAFFEKEGIMQQLLHQLKYNRRKDIGFFLGQQLARKLLISKKFEEVEAILPVPITKAKLHLRGYNQAEEIAKGIYDVFPKPILKDVLVCVRKSESQTKKTRFKRWENVSNKYQLQNAEKIKGKHILLVDDVITSGATIESCANQLLSVSGTKVSVASIAYTK